ASTRPCRPLLEGKAADSPSRPGRQACVLAKPTRGAERNVHRVLEHRTAGPAQPARRIVGRRRNRRDHLAVVRTATARPSPVGKTVARKRPPVASSWWNACMAAVEGAPL